MRQPASPHQYPWSPQGLARVPYWVYTDPKIYRREQERVFAGASWAYVGLTAELPRPGDFRRSVIGDKPVVVVRDLQGEVHVYENRCSHRGVQFCQSRSGNTREFMCPYHQWTFDLQGRLLGVPFRRGVKRRGGMPPDFNPQEHGLRRLLVTERHGVIFASFASAMPTFEEYLGASMLELFDRVFDGRDLKVLGYMRQSIPANWKLMFENIKDPYHASLLHVFLVTFGLFRADQPSQVKMDPTGRHAALISRKGEQKASEGTLEMKSFKSDFTLHEPMLLTPVKEFADDNTVVMQTLWPNLIIQQQSNTLATRQLVTHGPGEFVLNWTFFGYADDDPEMTNIRLRQANLMGPGGLVSVDDSEVMQFSQQGIAPYAQAHGVLEMGGRDWHDEDHMVTEAAIRAFWDYYRQVMEL